MGGRMRPMSNTTLLMTVLCLLLCLHESETQQEELKPGDDCEGKRKKLCPSGTKCDLGYEYNDIHKCRKLVGQKCKTSDDYCMRGTRCDGRERECRIWPGHECKGKQKHLCLSGYSCDANSVCKRKVGAYCYSSLSCGAGAECKIGRCSCIPEHWKRKQTVCVAVKGYVGAKCLENNVCKSPNSQCDTTTNRCVCQSGFLTSPRDFSCKAPLGSDCTDSYDCTENAFCDPSDNTCRLKPGESCAGDKENFCQVGKLCIDGYCRHKVGESCDRLSASQFCEPPSNCWSKPGGGGYVCGIPISESCANHKDHCIFEKTFCDPKLLRCQTGIGEYCSSSTYCPYGAICKERDCRCLPGGYWNATEQVCVPPPGKVGGKCVSEKNKCERASSRCNDDGICECKKGLHVDSHTLECDVKGPTCSVSRLGYIRTFFGEEMRVDLPCGFKLATLRCGSTLVEVTADNTFDKRIKNTYISALNVTITGKTKNGATAINTYTIGYLDAEKYIAKNKTKGSAWRVTPGQDPPVEDDHVRLVTKASTRDSFLKRKLLKINYIPMDVTKKTSFSYFGEVLIKCGMKTFKSLEKFPKSLCGRPEDKNGSYAQYVDRVSRRLKRAIPEAYPYVSRDALSSDRLADRAILLEQTVSQRNPYCQEASTIFRSGCPDPQAKLYNCSFMYDTALFRFKSSYVYCATKDIPEPAKLLASCLNVNCDRLNGDNKQSTCQTLKTASKACHKIPGSQTPSDLMSLADCAST